MHDFYRRHQHAIARARKLARKERGVQDKLDDILEPLAARASQLSNADLEAVLARLPADGFYRLELRTLLGERLRGDRPEPAPALPLPQDGFGEEIRAASVLVLRIDRLQDEATALLAPAVREVSARPIDDICRFLQRLPRGVARTELETFVSRARRGLDYEMVL